MRYFCRSILLSLFPSLFGIWVCVFTSWDDSDLGHKLLILVLVGIDQSPVGRVDVSVVARDWISSYWVFALQSWSVRELNLLKLGWWDLIVLLGAGVKVVTCLKISGDLSWLASSNRWPLVIELNLFELWWWNLVMLLGTRIEIITGLEIGWDLSRLASSNWWPWINNLFCELNLLKLTFWNLVVLFLSLV